MTQVISLVAPPKAMTPVHSSSPMELDEDHDGPRALRAAADTPDSPSPRTIDLSRKRAVSINTADASYAKFEHLKLDPPTNMNIVSPRDHVCLCTPAPKIPRPRNAFILYRQHHQAQVVAQNPNLSNPDISKIIGEQWNEEPEDIKANWKGLADEEKQRHQRQYPDYRYQPRRGSRAQANRPGLSPADDGARCPKCNGRSIVNPRTPNVPLSASAAAPPGMRPYAPPARGDETDMALRRSYGSLPPTRSRYLSHQPNQHEAEEYDLESPEVKRRRFNAGGAYHSVTSPHMTPGQSSRTMSAGAPPSSMRHYLNATPGLPELGSLPRSQSGPMAPPPRPPMSGPWAEHSPHPSRHHGFDESLRLPPLQTSVSMSPTAAGEGDGRQAGTPVTGLGISAARDPQPRSVEATVMSVSFVRKMTVLGRICQPVSKVRGSEVDTRGPVIAVEGPKPRILQQVGKAVEKALMEPNQFNLKTWANHSIQELNDGDIFDHEREGEPSESHGRYVSHLRTMMLWHEKSQEIEQHIAHRDGSKPNEAGEIPRRGSAESSSSLDSHGKPTSSNVPVALLKEGYSLTVSDMLACNVPITDAYGPIDHWQWLATLWRGVVGPDLVVYVKPSMDEEIAKHGNVHVQKRPGLVLVRIPVGSDLDEATERRVGFEVVEWVRAESYREGFGKT